MNQVYNVQDFYEDSTKSNNLKQLKRFLKAYKLSQYFQVFVSEGFDRLLSLFDITESDLISLNVKRGHRRLLQRAIATARGIPIATPIIINYGYYDYSDIPYTPEQTAAAAAAAYNSDFFYDEGYKSPRRNNSSSIKRRKQHIPSKPVTPFDEFLNEVRSDRRYEGLISAELIGIATEKWNNFTGHEKEKYEREALLANSDYVMGGRERQEASDMSSDM